MNKLLEQAKKLRQAASKLEAEAEALGLPALEEKYKNVVGTCYEIKEKSYEDKWTEYWYIKEIEHINVNLVGEETVSVICMRFTSNYPHWKTRFIGNEQWYLHLLESYGKKISREAFNQKFVEFQEKMLI